MPAIRLFVSPEVVRHVDAGYAVRFRKLEAFGRPAARRRRVVDQFVFEEVSVAAIWIGAVQVLAADYPLPGENRRTGLRGLWCNDAAQVILAPGDTASTGDRTFDQD